VSLHGRVQDVVVVLSSDLLQTCLEPLHENPVGGRSSDSQGGH
jgi:hypothetical protein